MTPSGWRAVPVTEINKLVDAFLAWPLPVSVCPDPIAMMLGSPRRSGTNLLTADEAKQMFEHVLSKVSTAPPSAEPLQGEREKFEAWGKSCALDLSRYPAGDPLGGTYVRTGVNMAWASWQFRAQQPSPPPSDALRAPVAQKWLVAFQVPVEVPGQRPQLAHAIPIDAPLFDTIDEACQWIKDRGLPLGWVTMTVGGLLPRLFATAPSAGSTGQAEPISDEMQFTLLRRANPRWSEKDSWDVNTIIRLIEETRKLPQAVDQQARRHEKLLIACRDAMKISRGNTDWRHMIAAIDAALAHPETPK